MGYYFSSWMRWTWIESGTMIKYISTKQRVAVGNFNFREVHLCVASSFKARNFYFKLGNSKIKCCHFLLKNLTDVAQWPDHWKNCFDFYA